MTEIYLIRHAEAEGNLYRRIQGHSDTGITLNGYRQIEALKKRFEPISVDAVYASDLRRTMLTAKAVYEPKGLTLHTSPDLREIHLGDWEDVPFGELEYHSKPQLDIFNSSPFDFVGQGAELFSDVCRRMARKLREIAAQNEGRTVAVFSHGCAMRALLYALFGKGDRDVSPFSHSDNTAVTHIFYTDGVFTLDYMNDNSHLSEEISTLARQKWWKSDEQLFDHNLWYEPLPENESWRYVDYRRDAWQHVYGSLKGFDGSDYLLDAKRTTEGVPDALVLARLGTDIAGLVQLNPEMQASRGIGYIPFIYLRDKYRDKGLGVQLIGYAVSFFRRHNRSRLRLRVAPSNERALHFYEKYGFKKIGEDSDLLGGTYVMEMEI